MPDHFYVYPAYLSQGVSRALGRRVPAAQSVGDVTTDRIVEAAKHLGFLAVAEPEKQYPRQFHTYAGRVKVTKKAGVSKGRSLLQIAEELKRPRPAATGGKK